jgi:outer membrane protein insertion porin family
VLATGSLLLATAAAAPAAAQQADPVVLGVRLEQEGRAVEDEALERLVQNSVGEPLSMRQVRESETHLMALNRFASLEVLSQEVPGGVQLTYRLFPLHPIDRVEFRGRLGVGDGTLRRAITERYGAAPPATRVNDVLETLHQVYRDNGYPDAVLTHDIVERHDPHRATLVITAQAGARALIKRIDWDEEDENSPGTFAGRPDVRANRPFNLAEIRRTLDRYVARMREAGYYEATAEPAVTFEDDGAVVTILLRRGPRVRIAFSGDPIPRAEQQRLVPVQTEASIVDDLLENWELAIEEYLRGLGHRDADVQPTRQTEPGELTITFDISKGPRFVTSSVVLRGQMAISEAELRDVLRLEEGEPFVEVVLDVDAAQMEELYLSRGFTSASVTADYSALPAERPTDPRPVEATITIVEGPRTRIGSVAFTGTSVFSDTELGSLVTLTEGAPLSETELIRSRDSLELAYRNLGYESVSVRPTLSRVEGEADGIEVWTDVAFAINEGPQIVVDEIIIDGNRRTSRQTILREVQLQPGDPMGLTALAESQSGLSELGLFRRVRLDQRRHFGETRRDLVVRVEEAPPTTLGYGGGMEISSRLRPTGLGGAAEERIEFVPRGFFEIGRRNMFGKNRSVNLFTRVSARARDTVSDGGVVESSYGVNEFRVYGTFREPKLFGGPAEMLVTAITERAIRPSYTFETRELRAQAGGTFSPIYSGAAGFSIENTELFEVDPNLTAEEKPLIDRFFPQVRLSKFSGSLIRNTRDNDLDPSRGAFVSADAEVAARSIGSEVGYVKTFVQGSWYRQLPSARRVIFAVRGVLGAAHGFPREVALLDPDGRPLLGDDGTPLNQVVQDLPASERFFAGGATTNRGFSLDRLGNADTISPGGFPTGGNGEILLNTELRVSILRDFAGVVFVDAGNVFKDAADLSLGDLRPAAGFGLHYRSFIGPIRAELGFNLDRQELTPGRLERGNVLHISLGPAF